MQIPWRVIPRWPAWQAGQAADCPRDAPAAVCPRTAQRLLPMCGLRHLISVDQGNPTLRAPGFDSMTNRRFCRNAGRRGRASHVEALLGPNRAGVCYAATA